MNQDVDAGRLERRVRLVGKNRWIGMADNFIKFSQRNCCKNCVFMDLGEFANKCRKTNRHYGYSDLDSEYGICDLHERDFETVITFGASSNNTEKTAISTSTKG
jgi:hypothetical protein